MKLSNKEEVKKEKELILSPEEKKIINNKALLNNANEIIEK